MKNFYKKVDYQYNIRGWLKQINDVDDLQDGTNPIDLFSFKLNYNEITETITGVKELYNGNIAEIFWKTSNDNTLRKYSYAYDDLNRLRNAVYQKPTLNIPVTNSYNEELDYDKNGNILTLRRRGEYDDPSISLLIDNLVYSYSSTKPNELVRVNDQTNNPNGFKDGTNTGDDYSYDANGNMIVDHNKGITSIRYNHLNLPTIIDFGSTGIIQYIYNASGVKVRKIVREGNETYTTDYLNGFQYLNSRLEFFPHAEGYVKVTKTSNNYVFNYTDHLGNVRLSYTKDPNTNVLTILEENNYYPFGLKHRNYNMTRREYISLVVGDVVIIPTSQTIYDYKYNGKEWQDELGLNMYDMDMRQYDPAIARWVVQDPIVHFDYSPYNAFDNNPVFWADPSGADADTYNSIMNIFNNAGSGITTFTNTGNGNFKFSGHISDEFFGGGGRPPVNGLAYFRDSTGEYFWDNNQTMYQHFAFFKDGSGSFFNGYYDAKEYSDSSNFSIYFEAGGGIDKSVYDSNHTILSLALPLLIHLTKKGGLEDISDESTYPGVKIFASEHLSGGGVTLGNMIFVKPSSDQLRFKKLLAHEYGHFLDFKYHFRFNKAAYITSIGLPSIWSATKSNYTDYKHHNSEAEKRANFLGGAFFGINLKGF